MVLIIELLILFIVFTLMVVPAVLKNPLSMVHDYPTDIYQVKGSLKGMLLGIPAALVAGIFVAIMRCSNP